MQSAERSVEMNSEVSRYIAENKVCAELIFRDSKEFLNVLFANGGKVEGIVWFDYCKISEQNKSLGGGGYADKQNSGYMWAETQIFEYPLADKSLNEILEYMDGVRREYSAYDLYPSFDITE